MFDDNPTPIMRGATASVDGGAGKVPKPLVAERFKLLRGDKTWVQAAMVYKGGVAGGSVPATSTTAGDYYLITSNGTSQGKTWVKGEIAVYEGTSGAWTQLAGVTVTVQVAMPTATSDAGNPGEWAIDSTKRADYHAGTGWLFSDLYQL